MDLNNNNNYGYNPVDHFTEGEEGNDDPYGDVNNNNGNRGGGGGVSVDNGHANNNSYINMNITPVPKTPPNYNLFPDPVPSPPVTDEPPVVREGPTLGTCADHIDLNYAMAPAVICAVCAVFGILYCFLGYRFFKATMFLTGFVFGSVVTYLVCLEQQLLPWEGKLELAGVAALFGVVVGLITMLVHQVGLFITGFSNGALLGTGALVIMEFFYHPRTVWICIGVVFLTGLVSALLILYFQKGLTILSTGMCGAALLTVAIDYYVEKFAMVYYVYDCVRNSQDVQLGQVCWFTWVILGIWPALFVIGILTQWNITGKGVDHKEVVSTKRSKRKVNLKKIRERESKHEHQRQREALAQSLYPNYYHDNEDEREQQMASGSHDPSQRSPTGTSRYLHLYQVRRVNGDVISQSYIQNIQHKLSTAVRKKVVAAPPARPPAQPSVECDQMQTSIIVATPLPPP